MRRFFLKLVGEIEERRQGLGLLADLQACLSNVTQSLTLASALRSCCSGGTLEVVVIVALAGHLVDSELSVRIGEGKRREPPHHTTLQPHATTRRGNPAVVRLSGATEKEPKPRAEISFSNLI